MKVLFLPEVEEYLYELAEILYNKDYFGFKEDATQYVQNLVREIVTSLPNKQKKLAPEFFSTFGKGMFYANFKCNQNTQWYVFFTIYEKEQTLLVRYIANNHTVSQHL